MSGGVDSSVSAALLQKAGYAVTGVFIKVWQPDWIECNWKEERLEAMRVAAHLDIPFVTLDLEREYKQGVIDYMIAEYKAGRTPNPDVMCNREVKFGAFWGWAKEQGADSIATGHYARVERIVDTDGGGTFRLLKGLDRNKDQSYFLWTLNQMDLAHVIFPIGHLEKTKVRELARDFQLPNAEKKDSQGLCFIGKVDIKAFLSHYLKTETGKVLDEQGWVIGSHPGAVLFTIGERHGFAIDDRHKTPNDRPYYVIAKDPESNTLVVSNKGETDQLISATRSAQIGKINWISGSGPEIKRKFPFQARGRYRQELQNIRLSQPQNGANLKKPQEIVDIEFENPQDTLTPGQSLVIYDGENCLGGGILI